MTAMKKLSLVMAACNQGGYLQETIDSATASLNNAGVSWEIIVVDDASDDGAPDNVVRVDHRFLLIKLHRRVGNSMARRIACNAATGDVIITCDPHCYFHRKFFRNVRINCDNTPDTIFQPTTQLDLGKHKKVITNGGGLTISGKGVKVTKARRIRKYVAFSGSVYIWPRNILEALGGWPLIPCMVGGTEPLLSIVCHRLGLNVKVARTCFCIHRRYRRRGKFPFTLPPGSIDNAGYYYHLVGFPLTFDEVWKPLLDYARWKQDRDIDWRQIFSRWPDYQRVTELLQTYSKMNELEFIRDAIKDGREDQFCELKNKAINLLSVSGVK